MYKTCNPVAPNHSSYSHTTYTEDLAFAPTIMLKFGTSCGKKIRLDLDISNKADTNEIFALLNAAGSDDESYIENLIEDSDIAIELAFPSSSQSRK